MLAHGETIIGRVVAITDGDTLAVLDASNTQLKYGWLLSMRQRKRKPSVSAESRSYPKSVMASVPASKSLVLTVMDVQSVMLTVPASTLIKRWLNQDLLGSIGNSALGLEKSDTKYKQLVCISPIERT